MDGNKQELLEIYKLHSELADRVSQRREGANKFFFDFADGFFNPYCPFSRISCESNSYSGDFGGVRRFWDVTFFDLVCCYPLLSST